MRSLLLLALLLVPASVASAQCELEVIESPHEQAWGSSLAVDGDSLLVGAVIEDTHAERAGAAWFYRRTPGGWVREARVFDPAGVSRQGFGLEVVLEGDVAAVSRPLRGIDGDQVGAVHVYRRVAGTWIAEQVLEPRAGHEGFGIALALADQVLYVGQRSAGSEPAGVEVFERIAGAWTRTRELAAPVGASGFGRTLAVHGDRVAVASADPTPLGYGVVYLFELDASGTFTQTQRFPVPEFTGHDSAFGNSLALDAERLYVGSPNYGSLTHPRPSAVFVYARESFGWVLEERLGLVFGSDDGIYALGLSIAVDGAFVYASTFGHVHVFRRDGAGWAALRTLVSADPIALDRGRLYSVSYADRVRVEVRSPRDDHALSYCTCSEAGACSNGNGTAGCANSTFRGARLDACGSPSVAADDLTLFVRDAPPRAPAFLFMGGARARAPFGDGERCVAPGQAGLFRYAPRATDLGGRLTYGPGLAALSLSRFGAAGAITAGSTWHFQVVLRDPGGFCGTGLATTQGLEVRFAP